MKLNLAIEGALNTLTMSTVEIASLTGKLHKNILRDAYVMLAKLKIEPSEFEGVYRDQTGRGNRLLNLPKRETLILVSGYSIELRARIIDRWQELEEGGARPGCSRSQRFGRWAEFFL